MTLREEHEDLTHIQHLLQLKNHDGIVSFTLLERDEDGSVNLLHRLVMDVDTFNKIKPHNIIFNTKEPDDPTYYNGKSLLAHIYNGQTDNLGFADGCRYNLRRENIVPASRAVTVSSPPEQKTIPLAELFPNTTTHRDKTLVVPYYLWVSMGLDRYKFVEYNSSKGIYVRKNILESRIALHNLIAEELTSEPVLVVKFRDGNNLNMDTTTVNGIKIPNLIIKTKNTTTPPRHAALEAEYEELKIKASTIFSRTFSLINKGYHVPTDSTLTSWLKKNESWDKAACFLNSMYQNGSILLPNNINIPPEVVPTRYLQGRDTNFETIKIRNISEIYPKWFLETHEERERMYNEIMTIYSHLNGVEFTPYLHWYLQSNWS